MDTHSLPDFTTREWSILYFRAIGLSAKQVGHRMDLAEQTVQNYTTKILQKLDAKTMIEALNKLGWIEA